MVQKTPWKPNHYAPCPSRPDELIKDVKFKYCELRKIKKYKDKYSGNYKIRKVYDAIKGKYEEIIYDSLQHSNI